MIMKTKYKHEHTRAYTNSANKNSTANKDITNNKEFKKRSSEISAIQQIFRQLQQRFQHHLYLQRIAVLLGNVCIMETRFFKI